MLSTLCVFPYLICFYSTVQQSSGVNFIFTIAFLKSYGQNALW